VLVLTVWAARNLLSVGVVTLSGFLIISSRDSALSLKNPPMPWPPYAAEQLQKMIDGVNGASASIPAARGKSTSPDLRRIAPLLYNREIHQPRGANAA
jgi:hypothetical protein